MRKQFIYIFLLMLCEILAAQQTTTVDFTTATVDLVFRPTLGEIGIDVNYEFEILQDTDSIYLDMRTLDTYKVYEQSFEGTSTYEDQKIILKSNFKKGEKHSVGLAAFTHPKKALYFIDWNEIGGRKQIWTQGQGKYTSSWLPSLDDVNEKIIFDFSITFDKNYEVIANGKLRKKESPNDSLTKWYFDMKNPMSSYLAAIAIGKYKKKTDVSNSGIPLEMYYYPEDEAKFEPTYRYTKQIFDFLEKEIGVAYPWQNYKQVPVKDFLYAGMENTGTTIFSDSFVTDSIGFIDKNYVNVNAHEMAHQWFGDLVTAKSGTHHWLQEGFATYYAVLAEREIFGEEYFYWKMYESILQLQAYNDGKGETVLNPNASSLTFYQKGAWVLHALRTKIGAEPFQKAVKRYLQTYQFSSVETNDFIKIAEEESNQNLDTFVTKWLVNPQLPEEFFKPESMLVGTEMLDNMFLYLGGGVGEVFLAEKMKNPAIAETYNASTAKKTFALFSKNSEYQFDSFSEHYIVDLLQNLQVETLDERLEIYREALKTENIKIRQTIAKAARQVPEVFRKDYEGLLQDASYVTKEIALFTLWKSFPEYRKNYLDQTKHVQGFHDKSFRILWLTLAMVTKEYSGNNTPMFYNELSGYTHPRNHFEVRQHAFRFLYEIQSYSDQNLADLINGAMHHNWRFAKYCRDLLDNFIKNPAYQENLLRVQKMLSESEKTFLAKRMQSQ